MNKMLLCIGVVYGVVVAFTTFEQILLSNFVDGNENISVPNNFSDGTHIGTWFLCGKKIDGAFGLNVFNIPLESIAYFKKTDKLPSETVLVKDLLSAKAKALTTGMESSGDEFAACFVIAKDTVKDLKGWRPKEK